MMLKIINLSKTYKGSKVEALKDISFSVKQGEFVALLGQNGAGKSTIINILAGNVKKNSGRVTIGGYDLDKNELETKKIFGIVPQEISFDFFFTAGEMLHNQSGYFGIKNNEKYIIELLEKFSLTDKKDTNSRMLSGGMKRRLLIAKALVHRPKLLILDEPTAGVDIELRHSLHNYINELNASGTTIILTTHYLEEAEKLCDRIIIIDNGKMIVDENKEKLLNTLGAETLMEFQLDTGLDNMDLTFLSDFSPSVKDSNKLHLKALNHEIGNVFKKLADNNVHYTNYKLEQKKLEDVYMQLINM